MMARKGHETGLVSPTDTTFLVVTPENVSFDFHLAGPFHRVIALALDLFLLGLILGCAGIGLGILGQGYFGLFYLLLFFLWWGYGGCMEALCNGQTLGKMALGLRVVSQSGLGINASQAVLRNILRGMDLFPPFFPGILAMVASARFQRLGDMAAGTMVVVENRGALPKAPERVDNLAHALSLIPPKFTAPISLREALTAYVGKRKTLSNARKREMASLVAAPLMRSWSLPKTVDPDLLLCALHEKTCGDRQP